MGALDAVRRGRRAAERLMKDQCVVRRRTGEVETDPDTFEVRPVYEVVYDPAAEPHKGRCKVQTYEGHESNPESGGATVTVQRSRIDFPVGAFAPQPGDVATIVRAHDSLLEKRSFRVVQRAPFKSLATAYRVFVDENVGEEVPPWPTA